MLLNFQNFTLKFMNGEWWQERKQIYKNNINITFLILIRLFEKQTIKSNSEIWLQVSKPKLNTEAKEKVVLFLEIGRVKKNLSPNRPQKSNVYENIYILFQKITHINKKTSTSKFIRICFFFITWFATKKSTVSVVL